MSPVIFNRCHRCPVPIYLLDDYACFHPKPGVTKYYHMKCWIALLAENITVKTKDGAVYFEM